MTEETPINYDLVKPEASFLNTSTPDDSGYMWLLMLVIIVIGLCLLGGYYYILYFYDSLTLEDAIEKAIKHFNQTNALNGSTGDTGDTGTYEEKEEEEEKEKEEILTKVLDEASVEGFSNYSAISSDNQKLGQLNWCFIDDNSPDCNAFATTTDVCMSGDIFPSRDVCINPKLRML
jgi:hypothetical protein